jgi:hypothetical protein
MPTLRLAAKTGRQGRLQGRLQGGLQRRLHQEGSTQKVRPRCPRSIQGRKRQTIRPPPRQTIRSPPPQTIYLLHHKQSASSTTNNQTSSTNIRPHPPSIHKNKLSTYTTMDLKRRSHTQRPTPSATPNS